MNLCGKDCVGSFFSTHYAAPGAKGATKQFIDQYKAKYGYEPDAVAALTWDAARLLLQAIQNTKGLTGDVKKDRQAVRDRPRFPDPSTGPGRRRCLLPAERDLGQAQEEPRAHEHSRGLAHGR